MMIIPTAEPFFFPGNRTGCLLVHGFTGAPKEMRWMGDYLASLGYSVLGVRLSGHATQPDDMVRMLWQDWLASVEDGYCLLKGIADRILIIGLSMGGILSLVFSSQHQVDGVVTMSTPFSLPDDPRLPFLRLASFLIPRIDKGLPDWQNPEAARDHVEYPYFSPKSILQLRDLLGEMRVSLPHVSAPALLIHSKKDGSVLPENAEKIYAALGSQQKKIIWLENSGHVIPREPDRFIAFHAVAEFIQHVNGSINKQ